MYPDEEMDFNRFALFLKCCIGIGLVLGAFLPLRYVKALAIACSVLGIGGVLVLFCSETAFSNFEAFSRASVTAFTFFFCFALCVIVRRQFARSP
jgi:hypothetical protein